MPYGDLAAQAVQRFATLEDLDTAQCTIEEREEYEPHLREGVVVYAGVDYEPILRRAEAEADVVIWDGGNNDLPFFAPDLHLVVTDPHRAGDELGYHPGEANFRRADVLVVSKTDSAPAEAVRAIEENARRANPRAPVLRAGLRLIAPEAERLRGRRTLVIEDGPTVTHGGLGFGAGLLVARAHGAIVVDPRPHAVGTLAETYRQYPHLRSVLPAMGYGPDQVHDLAETIRASGAEMVVDGSPVDLGRLIQVPQPIVNVGYEYEDREGRMAQVLDAFLAKRVAPVLPA
jgi:predicted GTPase